MSDKFNFKDFDDGRADQLLRDALDGYAKNPSPGLWKSISRKLLWKELVRFNFTNLSPKFKLAGTAGLLLIFTAFYFIFTATTTRNASTKPTGANTPLAFTAKNPIAVHPALPISSPSIEKLAKPLFETGQKAMTALPGFETGQKAMTASPGFETGQKAMSSSPGFETGQKAMASFSANDAVVETTSEITHILPFEAPLFFISPGSDTIIAISNANGILKFRKNVSSNTQFFSANLGIEPELAFYTEPEAYSKTNFWLQGGATYHISRFSLTTGFGLGYVYDDGKYRVEYKSRDSIGFFTGVTSYSVGANDEITYNTQTINVYDSLQHRADYRTKNRYSYLQVPLLLGYRFFESNRVSLTFQAGPAFSFLLGSRKADPVIEYRNIRIIRVDNDTPSRIQANFQIWANLYFEMRMNKYVSIYLEPSFKYYLNPMVTQENVKYKAPWTIGLGVGLQFNFGHKSTTQ